jgi:hypothetical protein
MAHLNHSFQMNEFLPAILMYVKYIFIEAMREDARGRGAAPPMDMKGDRRPGAMDQAAWAPIREGGRNEKMVSGRGWRFLPA